MKRFYKNVGATLAVASLYYGYPSLEIAIRCGRLFVVDIEANRAKLRCFWKARKEHIIDEGAKKWRIIA